MDWSYIAGYFDGEGHVIFNAPPSRPSYIVTGLGWSNTNRESLVAMRDFMQCGRLSAGRRMERGLRDIYSLEVRRCEDVLRVGAALLPHLIIKRERVSEMLAFVRDHRSPAPASWGRLAALGADTIRRLYWDQGLRQHEIARRVGVHVGAVSVFMSRNGIEARARGPRPRK